MDQLIVGVCAVAAFCLVAFGWWLRGFEIEDRDATDVHSGPDDVERRSRRAF